MCLSRRESEGPAERKGEAGASRPSPGGRGSERPRAGEGCHLKRLLILGGTSEAVELARRAAAEFGDRLDMVTSLAGRLPWRPALPGRVRVGGFGGAAGLAAYLAAERIDLLVDATHPFAAVISGNAAEACAASGVPRLMLVRPAWRPGPDDHWLEVDSLDQAGACVAAMARRVFLTTGPGGIKAFEAASGLWFLVRLLSVPVAPLALSDYETIIAPPPFTTESERVLMLRNRIDTLVTKNSGGPTAAKLEAARDAGVRVVMVRRPPMPAEDVAATVERVDDALAWLRRSLPATP